MAPEAFSEPRDPDPAFGARSSRSAETVRRRPAIRWAFPLTAAVAAAFVALLGQDAGDPSTVTSPPGLQYEVRETSIGQVDPSSPAPLLVVSPDRRRFAYLLQCEGGARVVVDGRAGPIWEWVQNLTFSPDGSHVAYAARTTRESVVVIDGEPGPRFRRASAPAWSSDGQCAIYAAERDGECFLVTGGEAGVRFRASLAAVAPPANHMGRRVPPPGPIPVAVCPGGRRAAFVAQDERGCFVVVDDRAGPHVDEVFQDSLVFSPDGCRCAYSTLEGGRNCAVVDGVPGPTFGSDVGPVCFSKDSQHYAYVGKEPAASTVVVDGRRRGTHRFVSLLEFSPDSQSWACAAGAVAHEGWCWSAIVDGRPDVEFDYVRSLVFSPDGSHLAYVGGLGDLEYLMLDGRAIAAHYSVREPVYSADGSRFAYVAVGDDGRFSVVADGLTGPGHDQAGPAVFSSSGSQFAYTCGDLRSGRFQYRVALDGEVGPTYDGIVSPLAFADSGVLEYVATRGHEVWLVSHVRRLDAPAVDRHSGR